MSPEQSVEIVSSTHTIGVIDLCTYLLILSYKLKLKKKKFLKVISSIDIQWLAALYHVKRDYSAIVLNYCGEDTFDQIPKSHPLPTFYLLVEF